MESTLSVNLDKALNIAGWMSKAELTFLAEQAAQHELIYEIGCYKGRSTRAMADNTKGVIFAIDPWDCHCCAYSPAGDLVATTDETKAQFYCNMYKHIKEGKVKVCSSTWADFKPDFEADFIFIDALHDYYSVRHDVAKALRFLKPSGILAGHDYTPTWPGVIKAVDEIFEGVNVVDTIWWIKNGY